MFTVARGTVKINKSILVKGHQVIPTIFFAFSSLGDSKEPQLLNMQKYLGIEFVQCIYFSISSSS
jgi:hypothetical protein